MNTREIFSGVYGFTGKTNLHQYHKINMKREIYVAYGYGKNKICVVTGVATGF